MKLSILLLGALLAENTGSTEVIQMKKITPILVVEEIEPSLGLWVDRLGFQKTAEVREGDKLGFVILGRDDLEVMYQTRLSIEKEVESAGLPAALQRASGQSALYLVVGDLDEIRRKLEGLEILVPYRKTGYGAEELWLEEPGGHLIGFAAFP
jgi:hypothetical protein